ncbi:hypothetical protein, partial [Kingella kingae]|uniref:hypothetical protein n=1 Tax=Kingella kingae TaxID=504 RepID=UPI001E2A5475
FARFAAIFGVQNLAVCGVALVVFSPCRTRLLRIISVFFMVYPDRYYFGCYGNYKKVAFFDLITQENFQAACNI